MKCLSRSRRHFFNIKSSKFLKARSLQNADVLNHSENLSCWQRLKSVLFLYFTRSKELAYTYTEAKVEKERSEARKIAEQADEIAAQKNLIRQKSAKEFSAVINEIFADDGLPTGAKAFKLAKLIEENPRVMSQLEKIGKIVEKFSLDSNKDKSY
jgi:hypothetical protein